MFCRDLCGVEGVQEGDWASVQADSEDPGDECGPHHHRRLHGTVQ